MIKYIVRSISEKFHLTRNKEKCKKIKISISKILLIFRNTASYSRFLPIANIGRIMKKSLPDNAKIAKDAK